MRSARRDRSSATNTVPVLDLKSATHFEPPAWCSTHTRHQSACGSWETSRSTFTGRRWEVYSPWPSWERSSKADFSGVFSLPLTACRNI